MSELKIKNFIKQKRNYVLYSLLAFVIGLALCGLGFYSNYKDEKDAKSFHEILAGDQKENVAGYIDVTYAPYLFATKEGETGKLYFIFDEEYMYVAKLSDDKVKEIKTAVNKKETYRLYGITAPLSSDMKKIGLEVYNDEVEDEKRLTSSDFDSYFGTLYLNSMGNGAKFAILLVIGALTSFTSSILCLAYGINFLRVKMSTKKMSPEEIEKIETELNAKDAFNYKNAHLVLANTFMLDYTNSIKIIPYEDIVWIYRYELRNRGIRTNISIMCYTKDKKRHQVALINGLTKKQMEILNEIMETIVKKNNKVYVGYDKETRKKVKEEFQIK